MVVHAGVIIRPLLVGVRRKLDATSLGQLDGYRKGMGAGGGAYRTKADVIAGRHRNVEQREAEQACGRTDKSSQVAALANLVAGARPDS